LKARHLISNYGGWRWLAIVGWLAR
jgi:hypothetical protein